MASTIATAYVQILPSFKGISASITSELKSVNGESAGKSIGSDVGEGIAEGAESGIKDIPTKLKDSIKSGLSGIASTVATGLAAVGTGLVAGIASVTSSAVTSYASYEQMVGGIQKLYGNMGQSLEEYAASNSTTTEAVAAEWQSLENAQNLVMQNAENAYKTSGMSMNTYMENATKISASLIKSLGGDTEAAAAQVDVAMRAISDNANTYGTDLDTLTQALQGFARGEYTMLDQLNLGFGGSKTGMESLIASANEYAASIGQDANLSIDSFSDIVTAIELVQEQQHTAGTTAREASGTIEGSVNQAKAAWENFLTVLGTGDTEQVSAMADNLVESLMGALENIVPVVQTVFESLAEALPQIMEVLSPAIQTFIDTCAPTLSESLSTLLTTLCDQVSANLPDLLTVIGTILNALVDGLIINPLLGLGQTLWEGLQGIWDTITSGIGEWVTNLAGQATEAGSGFIENIGTFFSQLPESIGGFLSTVISNIGEFISNLATNASEAGTGFLNGISEGFNSAVEFVAGIPGKIVSALGDVGSLLWNAGSSIIEGLKNGITSAISGVYDFVSGIAGKIASLKGPIPYDLKLLIPNGQAIMSGLEEGLRTGFTPVEDLVGGMASDISDGLSVGDVRNTVKASAMSAAAGLTKGTAAGGTTYNLFINDAQVNGDAAIKSHVLDLFADLDRIGAI